MARQIFREIICSVLIFLIFCCFFSIKRNLFPAKIIFYETIFYSIIFLLAFLIFSVYTKTIFKSLIIRSLFPSFLIILLFHISVPTILDRSVSVTLLGTLFKAETAISRENIDKNFNKVFLLEGDSIGIRLNEQIVNGNIKKDTSGKYFLTNKGEKTSSAIFYLAKFYNVNTSFIAQ
tara:strand:+ start:27359 stop:27889 length:531 start_codon:yes stop_codon:yes gene_type:complete